MKHFPSVVSLTVLFISVPAVVFAQETDKNGVTPQTISRPSGPGSLEGLGDAFQPALNTGMAEYAVGFDLPDGVAGMTPELALSYDSGNGFGMAGIGWTFNPGCIRLQTDKGLPRYGEAPDGVAMSDRFLGVDDEELVPLNNGYYLAKVEGAFVRYRHVVDAENDYWEAHTPGGVKLEFGRLATAQISSADGSKIFCWQLERQTDTSGNVIEYDYTMPEPGNRQIYLSEIRYGPGEPDLQPWTHYYSVDLTYEDRPDPFTDYRSGFRVCTCKRLQSVDVNYIENGAPQLIRRYELGYEAHPHWSLLSSVTQYGADGISSLPPTTLGYSLFELGDPETPVSAAGSIIASIGQPPQALDHPDVDLIDLNADGLPDILSTVGGTHVAYLNRGEQEQAAINWEGPIQVDADESLVYGFSLSNDNVHLADMNGDGVSDLVISQSFSVQVFENTGQLGWAAGRLMSIEDMPPPAPFGEFGQAVKISDLSFNKNIDVIQSSGGALHNWFNQADGTYTGPITTPAVQDGGQFVGFEDDGVELADMNGDRLNDVVKITPFSVIYWPSLGYGRFDQAVTIPLPDRYLDDSPGGNLHRARLEDINGDGLSDLVVERAQGSDLWLWLNLGDSTFEVSRVVTDLPVTPDAEVRWADINGNGTTDLIYADSDLPGSNISAVDLGRLFGGATNYNVLTSMANGYGRQTSITYRSSTEFQLDAAAAGNPWTTTIPFPTPVVSRTETTTGLDLDCQPGEDVYTTDFAYRDGYYDPLAKQFRGFAFVKQIDHGDEDAGCGSIPTLVTRHAFLTGAPDPFGTGELDECGDLWQGCEAEPLKGVELWREVTALPDDPADDGGFVDDAQVFERVETTWEVRDLSDAQGGALAELLAGSDYHTGDEYDRVVRFVVNTQTRTTVIERGSGAVRVLLVENDVDALGNELIEWNQGDINNDSDNLYTQREYGINEPDWIVDRLTRVQVFDGDPAGGGEVHFVSESRNYYDGPEFVGLPLGQIGSRGLLHRSENLVSGGMVPDITEQSLLIGDPQEPNGVVDVLRQQFDEYGNPIVIRDADWTPGGDGHERQVAYDVLLHAFPVAETIILGGGQDDLQLSATYDSRFGNILTITDFNGHLTSFTYDTFGRLEEVFNPDDSPESPTSTYFYDLGAPISSISTIARDNAGTSPEIHTTAYFDGLGRKLGDYDAGEPGQGGPVLSGVTRYNARGLAWKVYEPYFCETDDVCPAGGGQWPLPAEVTPATTMSYDATGRVIESITPPDSESSAATLSNQYLPLEVRTYDGEDNRTGGPHAGTYTKMLSDGLGRLTEVQETVPAAVTPDLNGDGFVNASDLAQLLGNWGPCPAPPAACPADFNGDMMVGAFDLAQLLGSWGPFDPPVDTAVTHYRYALPDYLAEIEDAHNNIKYMRYDGLGRRIFMNDLDRGHLFYRFDAVGNLTQTTDAKGQVIDYSYDGANRVLAEDYPGDGVEVQYHYDVPSIDYPGMTNTAGKLSWVQDLSGAEFRGYDNHGHIGTVVKRIPDAGDVPQDYTTTTSTDNLGRVYELTYPDKALVSQSYDARGLLRDVSGFVDSITYGPSGQRQSIEYGNGVTATYDYDPRGRLRQLSTSSPARPSLLQDLTYDFDQADNIVGITDGRPLAPGDLRNQTADFVLDSLYRLITANGAEYGTINFGYDPLGNMLTKTSPDIADPDINLGTMMYGGVAGTTGRIGRDPGDPPGPHALTSTALRLFEYDANGNMVSNDGDVYEYDAQDQLTQVTTDSQVSEYVYDYSGRRVIKRAGGIQTTYVNGLFEIRNDAVIHYIFAGDQRVARVEQTGTSEALFPRPPPLRLNLPATPQHLPVGSALGTVEVFYYHPDHLGSTNVVTNDQGQIVSESYNYPFGKLRHQHTPGDPFDPLYQFTGKEQDAESGLHYFEARYLDAPLGRFISVDPLLSHNPIPGASEDDPFAELRDPQLLNLYAYGNNNPIRFIDPTGTLSATKRSVLNVVAAAAAGAAGGAVAGSFAGPVGALVGAVLGGLGDAISQAIKETRFYNKTIKKFDRKIEEQSGPGFGKKVKRALLRGNKFLFKRLVSVPGLTLSVGGGFGISTLLKLTGNLFASGGVFGVKVSGREAAEFVQRRIRKRRARKEEAARDQEATRRGNDELFWRIISTPQGRRTLAAATGPGPDAREFFLRLHENRNHKSPGSFVRGTSN